MAVVSNIGFDIRALGADLGFAGLVDEFVLSYEVGRCKPDPAIFLQACAALRADPERTLMVGDTPADAGAAAAGCSVLVIPPSDPGRRHGLAADPAAVVRSRRAPGTQVIVIGSGQMRSPSA